MMTKQKFNPKAKLRTLTLIPLAAMLFFIVGCINGQQADEEQEKMYNEQETATEQPTDDQVVAAIAATKMNVVYVGVENPIAIAVSGYKPSELEVTCRNGKITGSNGLYKLYPSRPGNLYITVAHNGETIQQKEFRVKTVPDPVAKIAGLKGGLIKKEVLLEQKGLDAEIENFDYDLSFRIVEFVVSATIDGYVKEAKSSSNMLTAEQKEIITKLKRGNKAYFESIKVVGPDRKIREVPSISLLIDE